MVGLGLSIAILSVVWDEPVGTEFALADTLPIVEAEEYLTVAFLGDHGTGRDARRVFELIKAEGADMVLSQGDLGYDSSPEAFERLLDETLGPEFPFFASLGNHDRRDWRRYAALLESRAERVAGLACEGKLGIKAACSYKGLFFITSAVKVFFFDTDFSHADFISDQLSRTSSRWRVYEARRKGGAKNQIRPPSFRSALNCAQAAGKITGRSPTVAKICGTSSLIRPISRCKR